MGTVQHIIFHNLADALIYLDELEIEAIRCFAKDIITKYNMRLETPFVSEGKLLSFCYLADLVRQMDDDGLTFLANLSKELVFQEWIPGFPQSKRPMELVIHIDPGKVEHSNSLIPKRECVRFGHKERYGGSNGNGN